MKLIIYTLGQTLVLPNVFPNQTPSRRSVVRRAMWLLRFLKVSRTTRKQVRSMEVYFVSLVEPSLTRFARRHLEFGSHHVHSSWWISPLY